GSFLPKMCGVRLLQPDARPWPTATHNPPSPLSTITQGPLADRQGANTVAKFRPRDWTTPMLRGLNDKVKECYARAAEAREQAIRENNPAARETWFKLEDRWVTLAQSRELTESLSDFSAEVRRFLGTK